MRLGVYKLCKTRRRPLAEKQGGIGVWEHMGLVVVVRLKNDHTTIPTDDSNNAVEETVTNDATADDAISFTLHLGGSSRYGRRGCRWGGRNSSMNTECYKTIPVEL